MNTTSATTHQQDTDRGLRKWSGWGLGLLLPMVVLSCVPVLASGRGSRCITYGDECSAVPGAFLYGCFWTAVVAGLTALLWPRARWTGARAGIVVVQWTAQVVLACLILSYA
ncbi:hypothetical protein [Streptomyces sp. YIM S03343]